ncbi:hypothetical protein TUBRATIS_25190 [Tubulinosema ratisbonensis]|uniref:Uncharacterized protein n=1 Tax=Tubulinosema ratisbonensis TaxID=291195 RepID=A0A437AIM9_9MICR|nr:hypothetical protein TUBRATIS_25190 [Tubulinosema ratisbonensis]
MFQKFFGILQKKVEDKKITPYVKIEEIQKEFSDYVQEYLIAEEEYKEYKEITNAIKSWALQLNTLATEILTLKNNLDEMKLSIEKIFKIIKVNDLDITNDDQTEKLNEMKINNFKDYVVNRKKI